MSRSWQRRWITLFAFLVCCTAAVAQEELNENERLLLSAVEPLQQSVLRNDRAAVAKLLIYPLDVWNGRTRVTIESASQFLRIYDHVVDFRLKRTIARADVRKALSNYAGFMFDRGRIWFGMRGEDFGVVTINPPSMHRLGDSVPFDKEDTVNFPGVIAEYLGQPDGIAHVFLFTAADGDAHVSIGPQKKGASFTIGATKYRLDVLSTPSEGKDGHMILRKVPGHHAAKK